MNRSLFLAFSLVSILTLAACAGEPTATQTFIRTTTPTPTEAPTPVPNPTLVPTPTPPPAAEPTPTPTLGPTPTPALAPAAVWLSAGPRGVQFTSDFQLAELFRDDDSLSRYQEMAIGPQGREIYAIRTFGKEEAEFIDPQETAIVRLSGLQGEKVQTEVVLKYSDLKDPALWDLEVDLPGLIFPGPWIGFGSLVSVANNGDLFLVSSVWTGVEQLPRGAHRPEGPPAGTSLILRHPDGRLQKVLTIRELVDKGLLDPAAADQTPRVAVAPAAPDRLWVQFITDEYDRSESVVRRSIFQVQDPNGDGDWSDRTVVPLTLPTFVAEQQRGDCCPFMGLVAEPSLGGVDRLPSFLLLMSTPWPDVEYRIYRVADHNGDGDALDAGEFELLFAGTSPSEDPGSIVAPRIVARDGKVVLRELVVGGLIRGTRVSRILETGEVIDIARAFNSISDVFADPEGNIYVWAGSPDGSGRSLYKLKPVPEGTRAESGAVTLAAQPFPTPEPSGETLTPGIPRIAYGLEVYETPETGEIFLMGADGSGPVKLVGGVHNGGFCASADSSLMGFWSSEEVPNEPFVYVANADGSNPRKVTEGRETFWCRFSADSLPLTVRKGRSTTLIRHDLKSGVETTVLTGAIRLNNSPDGPSFLFVSGLDFTKSPPAGAESLEVVDIDTGERRLLHGPLSDAAYRGSAWSTDGQQVAFVVAPTSAERAPPASEAQVSPPPASDYGLYARDLAGAEAILLYQFEAEDDPSIEWSSSGEWLLLGAGGVGPSAEAETQSFIGAFLVTLHTSEAEKLGIEGGVLTEHVTEDGPSAGILEMGDVITAINGEKITGVEEIRNLIRASNPGDVLTLTLIRAEEILEVDVIVGQRDVPPSQRERGYVLVNVESGESRQVLSGDRPFDLVFNWAPNEDMFAYANSETLFLESVNGDVFEVLLPAPIGEACSWCDSFGWSPDGRYIGLTDYWQTFAVLDTTTGEVRSLFQEERANLFVSPKWWR